ncbi:serine/threonine-protein kinase [Nocardia callitridis]|uniref:non-specific serine/threonine protein kinase n=1 Tax=Nocardia callitridis TaxID=648753 RepID=A0ABP9KBU3_9NOCA
MRTVDAEARVSVLAGRLSVVCAIVGVVAAAPDAGGALCSGRRWVCEQRARRPRRVEFCEISGLTHGVRDRLGVSEEGHHTMTTDRLIAGRYRLSDPIGSGAMGVVWRAEDVRLRRTVAVKQLILAPGLSKMSAMEAKLRAMREGRIAARLHHPHAITVFDVAEEDGQPWLVMEYMNAPSLAVKLAGHRTLPPLEVAKIGAQAASALTAAHDAGIMHRDVKPANLLVADDGTVKITDFGISRAVGDVTVTATGFLAGTPAYLAPEVARGEDPEPASDVFALGSTLYAAVSGTPPFGEGDNPLAVLHAVARGQVKPPENTGALGPVLMSLLAPTVDARPTMHEAQQALNDVVAGRTPPPPPSSTKVMPKPGAAATAVLPEPEPVGPVVWPSDSDAPKDKAPKDTAAQDAAPKQPAPATTAFDAAGSASRGSTPTPPREGPTGPTSFGGSGAAEPVSAHPAPNEPAVPFASTPDTARRNEVRRNRLWAVGAGAAVLLVVIVGLLLASLGGGDDDTPTAAPPSAALSDGVVESGAPAPSSAATTPPPSATTTPAPTSTTTTTTPPPTTTPSGPPTPERLTAFVQGYYSTVPGNVAGGWSQLGPSYQAQTGGYDAYSRFWGTVRSVSVGSVTASGSNRVVASLTYHLKNGSTSSEQRWFDVTSENGQLLIAASGT